MNTKESTRMWLLLFLHLNRQSLPTTNKLRKKHHQHHQHQQQHQINLISIFLKDTPTILTSSCSNSSPFLIFSAPISFKSFFSFLLLPFSVDPKWPLFSTPLELPPLCLLPTPYIPTLPSFSTLPDPSLFLVFFLSLFF